MNKTFQFKPFQPTFPAAPPWKAIRMSAYQTSLCIMCKIVFAFNSIGILINCHVYLSQLNQVYSIYKPIEYNKYVWIILLWTFSIFFYLCSKSFWLLLFFHSCKSNNRYKTASSLFISLVVYKESMVHYSQCFFDLALQMQFALLSGCFCFNFILFFVKAKKVIMNQLICIQYTWYDAKRYI